MADDKSKVQPEKPGESDSLSATGMFLRAFGEGGKPEASASDPFADAPPSQREPAAQPGASGKAAPGEFTQLFQSMEGKPGSAAAAPQAPARGRAPEQAPSNQSAGGPGEFTRIFAGGGTPAPAPAARLADDATRAVPASPSAPRSKGYSAPGGSASASGDAGFTQLFNVGSPANPSAGQQPAAPSPSRTPTWNDDPIRRPAQPPPSAEPPSQSVTTLLASLGNPSAPSGRPQEPAPYRPEPMQRSPLSSAEPQVSSEGVTRLIQRLAQAPVEPAPAAPAAPPVSAGPGEFTRMISRLESPVAEPAPATPAPQPPPPAPAFVVPAVAIPAVPQPAVPHAPKFTPPAAHAAAAPPMPAMPKPPAIAAPALAPPKGKLEGMVPILLVINTFLLLILLVAVIFLIKAR